MARYRFFLDETGDHSLSFVDESFPLFLLAGCLFTEEELTKTENKIYCDKEGKIDGYGLKIFP